MGYREANGTQIMDPVRAAEGEAITLASLRTEASLT
jgi:hypothetical protein